jgi:hypothetical protein
MKYRAYEGLQITTFDVEDGRIIIRLKDIKVILTAVEDHGYPMIEFEEENVNT